MPTITLRTPTSTPAPWTAVLLPALSLALCLALCLFPAAPAPAQQSELVRTAWSVHNLDDKAAREAGLSGQVRDTGGLLLVLALDIDPAWYTYANTDPGLNKRPTTLALRPMQGQEGGEPLPVYYPPGKPKPDTFDPATTINAYQGRVLLFVPLPPEAAPPVRLDGKLSMVLCQETRCAEPRLDVSLDLTEAMVAQATPVRDREWWPLFLQATALGPGRGTEPLSATFTPVNAEGQEATDRPPEYAFEPVNLGAGQVASLLPAILLGLLAGLILNVMPCVLPVISLKLAAVLSATGDSPRQRDRAVREHGLFFALGVLLYFLFLAGLLGLGGLAWGELFQHPAAVLSISVLVFLMALSLMGVFHLPVVDLKFGRHTTSPKLQALFTGLLATLLATPCSGPFLGGVLSWSLAQPTGTVAIVFLAVGLGMALPYLGLAAVPGLARFMPRPGAWTVYVEKGVGLFLMATCIYLVNILPASLTIRALIVFWVAGVAAWLWRESYTGLSRLRPPLLRLLGLGLIAGSMLWALAPRHMADPWESFDPAVFQAVLGQEVLLVDFTADWCPTCKLLEATTLADKNVAEWEKDYGVRAIRVDLSEDFPAGEALRDGLGARSIPLLAVFPKGDDAARPLVLRDLFTTAQVRAALNQATD